VQIPMPQLIRLDSLKIAPVVSDDSRVEIWDSFLSLQIKETTRISYTKALADFCLKVYPDFSVPNALQSFLALSQFDAIDRVLTYRKLLINLKLSSATINQRLSALKSLVDYARRRGLCNFTLTDVKGLRSQKYRDTRGRTVDEYRSVLAEIDRYILFNKPKYWQNWRYFQ
jgi:integrase/recombinase XerC